MEFNHIFNGVMELDKSLKRPSWNSEMGNNLNYRVQSPQRLVQRKPHCQDYIQECS